MNSPRVPYLAADLAEPAELVAAIRARRGGQLLHLDRLLLHSPPFAAGWNALLRATRNELALDPRLRELAICAVAVLNDAAYEFDHHAPEFLHAGGSREQLAGLRDPAAAAENPTLFDATERAALHLAIAMTRDVSVDDATFAAVRAHLDQRGTVELVGVVAAYNMVSRFLVALRIGIEPPVDPGAST